MKFQLYNNKGACLLQLHSYEEALKALNIAIDCQPNNISAIYNKGIALRALGNYKVNFF